MPSAFNSRMVRAICRTMTGASLLVSRDHHDVVALDGGPGTWSTGTNRSLAVGS